MNRKSLLSVMATLLFAGLLSGADAQVVVKVIPPRPRVKVVKPPRPSPGHVWIKGHWKWNKQQHQYVWIPGHWVKRKKGQKWIPGHWVDVPKGHKWVPGHWARI